MSMIHYQTYEPSRATASLIKCFWTLDAPAQAQPTRQQIVPDGCPEIAFILADDIKRYTSADACIIQPRAMVLGQITQPFFIEPTGVVSTFAVRLYPYGFASLSKTPIKDLTDTETPLAGVFGIETAHHLDIQIREAKDTAARIAIMEAFIVGRLTGTMSIDDIVKQTIDAMVIAQGNISVKTLLKDNLSKRRQLERRFVEQIGISPKQLGRVIRLQTALRMALDSNHKSLTAVAYKSGYYDQAHFTKDFKEFTGMSPKEFFGNKEMVVSSLFYK